MSDYIERDKALNFLIPRYDLDISNKDARIIADRFEGFLKGLPAADVRPVVRGEWKKAYADHEAFGVRPFYRYCSKCHEATVHQYNFCPNCGADMREVKTDG